MNWTMLEELEYVRTDLELENLGNISVLSVVELEKNQDWVMGHLCNLQSFQRPFAPNYGPRTFDYG